MGQIIGYERLEYCGNPPCLLEDVSNASELDEANLNGSECSSWDSSDEECAADGWGYS